MYLTDYYTELMVYVNMAGQGKTDILYENAEAIINKLIDRSKKKAIENNIDESIWHEGFFPVAAWIDETILCSVLPWKEEWYKCLLQRKYFNINNAGELFFQKLEKMDSMSSDLLSVYELVIATGFKGVYYQNTSTPILTDIKNAISIKLRKSGEPLSSGRLFECAYQQLNNTRKNEKKIALTLFNMFNIAVITVPVFILVILHLLLDADLDRRIDKSFNKVKIVTSTPH